MKIGIHTLWMDSDPYGGNATYLKTLIQNLGAIDTSNQYTIYYAHPKALATADYVPAHFRTRVLWPSSLWIEIPISLPLELRRRPVDVLHVLAVAPPRCPVPFVQTIQDITWETHPEVYPWTVRFRLSKVVRATARRAAKIVTTSEFSKRTIVERYGVPDENVVVTYHGVDPYYKPVLDPLQLDLVRLKYGIPGSFILYVGKLQARKNLARLLRAFFIVKRERRLPQKLVLVGKRTWMSDDIMATMDDLGIRDEVIVTGEVPREDLRSLYSATDVFVFPSLCEGYGLPPLEAMACGAPVVSSNATSLPEVVGDAAILVDPYDVNGLAHAMYSVLTAEELRTDLISRGFKQATAFSSVRMAQQVVDIYEEVAGLKHPGPRPRT